MRGGFAHAGFARGGFSPVGFARGGVGRAAFFHGNRFAGHPAFFHNRFAFRHHRFFRNRFAFVGVGAGYDFYDSGYDSCYVPIRTVYGWRWTNVCY
jgi:hypothetical protein